MESAAFFRFTGVAQRHLYRCIKPLWFTEIEKLKEAGTEETSIQACLDQTEELQTKGIPFAMYMGRKSSKDLYYK